ncbi:DNA mismatch repair endonuclease MutL [Thiohalophilus thiocyanatoxydans]|uniref:DNA mismatch repair protein MutL n=1 Tax=Thiohalophilus thiocyanatoxydans TaxID=381308 RepID=A0A4R8IJX6_9GAMM|nr:DNA mismatch repair endonuclease MutL [Thiohalophilus thiocyanatoxydans]TDX99279.1 DNA mismatch repair protein MutL [Thiohalophilus thiocyanatoxydans]
MQTARRYQPDAIIQRLPSTLANQIAAGEVVERPASIVKELVENALDAGASRIEVQIRQGGLEAIRVSDDGYGIRPDELELAVSPHATSKIASLADLENIASLGFRGEALASIGSVARLTIESRVGEAGSGWRLSLNGREAPPELTPAAHPVGTSVSVSELFYNTPARRRFLRTERTEYRYIEDMLKRLALSRFEVGFTLIHNQREIFRLPPATQPAQRARRVERLCGKAFYRQAWALDFAQEGLRLSGWLGGPQAARAQADLQYVYVNGRSVRDKLINHALRQAYQPRLYPGRHPAWVLYLELDPLKLDVNVHPTKHEVRFHEARRIHDFLAHAVNEALERASPAADAAPAPAAGTRAKGDDFYTPAEGNIPASWQIREAAAHGSPIPAGPEAGEPHEAAGDRNIVAALEGGYLVVAEEDGLLLVNGRAVRRAQLAEQLADTAPLPARPLLIPQTLALSADAVQWLEQQEAWLASRGFDLAALSETAVRVRQIPVLAAQTELSAMLPEFIAAARAGEPLAGALARAISDHQTWNAAEQQALVRDALRWQAQAQPARYWTRWDGRMLQGLFAG